jgi:hypothetical protein
MLKANQLAGFGSRRSSSSAAPTPDILWWQFTDGSGSTVTATVGPNGTLSGSPTWATGKSGSGYCIQFDGVNDALISASNVTYGVNVITVCMWQYLDAAAYSGLLGFESTFWTNTAGTYAMSPDNGVNADISCYLSGNARVGGDYLEKVFDKYTAAAWHHVAIVFDNSTTAGNIKCYVDGALLTATSTPSNTKAPATNFTAATFSVYSRSGPTGYLAGRVDDVRIYGYELSAGQVTSVYGEAF